MKRRTIIALVAVFLAGLWIAYEMADATGLPRSARADRIVVEKSRRLMTLYSKGKPLMTYRVALGRGEPGQKVRRGDNRSPEGVYRISGHNPGSKFHLSLRISYPSPRDVEEAKKRGEDAGDDIMIHGIGPDFGWVRGLHRRIDWTAGCVAVTNAEIEEIYRAVPNGVPIEIRP
jgi:murein L,D-transpeptidase YafK